MKSIGKERRRDYGKTKEITFSTINIEKQLIEKEINMNKVILCGRTCSEWKTRKYGEGKSFVTNTLAISEGKDKTEFVSVVAFGKNAEVLYKYVKKGDMVLVEGSLHTSVSEKDGNKHSFTSVIVLRAELLPNARKTKKESAESEIQF